jgi:hypothetical protein
MRAEATGGKKGDVSAAFQKHLEAGGTPGTHLANLGARFSDEEVEAIWRGFAPLDAALQGEGGPGR